MMRVYLLFFGEKLGVFGKFSIKREFPSGQMRGVVYHL